MAGAVVGRQTEQEGIGHALTFAQQGHGSVVAITGEAGIGKSTLAGAAAARATESGFAVLRGHCHEAGGAPAFWPWIEILRGISQWMPVEELDARLGRRRATLNVLSPELAGEPSADLGSDSEETRFLLFDAAMATLVLGSELFPLLIVIEDLHVADIPTLLLLDFVSKRVTGHRIVVLVTYREIEARLNAAIDEVLAPITASGRHIALGGLSTDEVAALVGGRSDDAPKIHEMSNGNPLMAQEVAGILASESESRVPSSARTIFVRRLQVLDETAREIVTAAAVVGVEFEIPVVADLVDVPVDRVMEGVSAAMRAGIFAELEFPTAMLRFRHSLIRDAIYDSLSPTDRALRHSRAASALRLRGGAQSRYAAALAHHSLHAVLVAGWQPAVEAAVQAAERAIELLAFEDASRVLRDALGVVPIDEDAIRLDLLIRLGAAVALSRDPAPARALFDEAERLARETGDMRALAAVALSGGSVPMRTFGITGVPDERQIALLDEVLERLPREEEQLRSRLLTRLAGQLWWAPGTHRRRDELTSDAADIARRLDDPGLLARALLTRYTTVLLPPKDAAHAAQEAIAAYRRCGDLASRAQAEVIKFFEAMASGDLAAARSAALTNASIHEQIGIPAEVWGARLYLFAVPLIEGRFAEAERMLDEFIELSQRNGVGDRAPLIIETVKTMIVRRRFRIDELRQLAEVMRALHDSYPGMAAWLPAAGLTLSWLGDDSARAVVDEAVASFDALSRDVSWPTTTMLLADACVVIGAAEYAPRLHAGLLPYEGRAGMIAMMDVYGPVDRSLGGLEGLMGRWDDSERHFEAAIELDRRMRARPSLVQTRLEYARMLKARARPGDADRLAGLVADALGDAATLGMDDLPKLLSSGFGLDEPIATARPDRRASSEAVLQREGDMWSVSFGASSFSVRDSKGMQQLARLVAAPGSEIHVLDLAGGASSDRERAEVASGASTAGAALDERAKAEYRQRVTELQEEIDDAEDCADIGRASKAREELQFLLDELAGAVGLGGRDRPTASPAERARVAVTKTIRSAIDRITEHDQRLGDHLRSAVSTGVFCSYRPDPTTSFRVRVENRT